jgi:uncharacterized membrane protein YjjP (DUF1212 family)
MIVLAVAFAVMMVLPGHILHNAANKKSQE